MRRHEGKVIIGPFLYFIRFALPAGQRCDLTASSNPKECARFVGKIATLYTLAKR